MSFPRDVIFLSTADWDNPFWTNKQHMTRLLSESGFRVLYIESVGLRNPSTASKDLRRIYARLRKGMKGIRRVRENIWVYSPLVIPFHIHASIRWFNRNLLVHTILTFLERQRFERPIVWTYNPLAGNLISRLPKSMVIYHCVDDLSAIPGMPASTIRQEEENLVRQSDLIFTTSQRLFKFCSRIKPGQTHYHPNVADFGHFSRASQAGPIPPDLERIPRPRIGFIGAISDYKLDIDLIARVAACRSSWHWVLIGEVGEGQPQTLVEKLRLSNIHFLGPKPYGVLPDYLRGMDVTTIPVRQNAYTAAMFPMKFFEYLAAGKPVVSVPLPALEPFRQTFLEGDGFECFIQAVEKTLSGKTPDPNLGLDLARKHTWEWRLKEMMGILEKHWESKASGR